MRSNNRGNEGQMLLATGVVLMMSLLSMAIFAVKMAGISMPYDTAGDDTIQASGDIADSLPALTEARAQVWYDSGYQRLKAYRNQLTHFMMMCCIMEKLEVLS